MCLVMQVTGTAFINRYYWKSFEVFEWGILFTNMGWRSEVAFPLSANQHCKNN